MGAIGRFEGLADFLAVNNEPRIILAVWKVAVGPSVPRTFSKLELLMCAKQINTDKIGGQRDYLRVSGSSSFHRKRAVSSVVERLVYTQ